MIDMDRSGLQTRVIKCKDGVQILNGLPRLKEISAIISVSIETRKKLTWTPWFIRTCNEICRYASGIDLGISFNPRHFYGKLLKYRHKRNYTILSHWRRSKHGISNERR